jgi:hypothetical protein
MIKKIMLFMIFLTPSGLLPAFKATAAPLSFLEFTPGARPAGMGSAFTGLADDANASLFNPAGLANMGLHQFEISASIGFLPQDRVNNFLSASQQLPPKSYLGFHIVQFGISGIEGSDENGLPTSDLQDTELSVATSYAYDLDYHFKLGLSGSFIYQNLAGVNARGFGGIDVGIILVPSVLYDFTLGACVRHLGGFLAWDTGTMDRSNPNLRVGISQKFSNQTLILAYDAEWPTQTNLMIIHHAGIEWWPDKSFAIRGGWNQNDPTLGLSLRHLNYSLDYAYEFETKGLGGSQHITFNISL